PNRRALMEERMYKQLFPEWSAPGDWRKVMIRAFAIKREVFLSVGGFALKYQKFCEWFLAATLHWRGYRLGYAEKARMYHYYPVTVEEFSHHLYNFTHGEFLARLAEPEAFLARYFEAPSEWANRSSFRAGPARAAMAVLLKAALGAPQSSGLRGGWRSRMALLGEALRKTPYAFFGPYWGRWKAWCKRTVGLVMLFATALFSEDWMYHWYLILYFGTIEHARWIFLCSKAAIPADAEVPENAEIGLGDWPIHLIDGFYSLERSAAGAFRWSMPLAKVNFNVPAGRYRGELDMLAIRKPSLMSILCNGRPVGELTVVSAEKATFHIDSDAFVPGPAQTLTLVANPLPPQKADARVLCLPVKRIRFTPVKA
ncbi:MAG: hypothetical protein KIS92_11600, partial [Planctomycetota bacterium]|nr:hypothetical protein [Planctomycetota bacterium]